MVRFTERYDELVHRKLKKKKLMIQKFRSPMRYPLRYRAGLMIQKFKWKSIGLRIVKIILKRGTRLENLNFLILRFT